MLDLLESMIGHAVARISRAGPRTSYDYEIAASDPWGASRSLHL